MYMVYVLLHIQFRRKVNGGFESVKRAFRGGGCKGERLGRDGGSAAERLHTDVDVLLSDDRKQFVDGFAIFDGAEYFVFGSFLSVA